MDTITCMIDSKPVTVPVGTTIMEAADGSGIRIPRLCNHKSLKPSGACRLCIVEDVVRNRFLSSCTTPVEQDMAIKTGSERVITHRKNIIRLIMAEHPESCLVCGKGNQCELRNIATGLNVGENTLNPTPNFHELQKKNPFIRRDMGKCILCGRCIRACRELVGHRIIDYMNRGFHARPATLEDGPLSDSDCIFCGTCVSMCPTGALLTESHDHISTPEEEKNSVCGFCSVGCHIKAGVFSSRIVEINPAHEEESINNSTLCLRGHFAHDYLDSEKRLKHPMIRKNGTLERVTWDEAIRYTGQNLKKIRKKYGPQSMGFYGSSKCSCEENYYFKKLAAGIFQSNHTDNGSAFYDQDFLTALSLSSRSDGMFTPGKIKTLKQAGTILVFGNSFEMTVPVAGFIIRQALAQGTTASHFGYTDKSFTSPNAKGYIIQPGSELALLNGILVCLTERLKKSKTIKKINGYKEFISGIKQIDFKTITRITGLSDNQFKEITNQIDVNNTHILVGPEFMQHEQRKEIADAVLNLSLLAGSRKYQRGNIHLAITENNALGSYYMGMRPDALPGGESSDTKSRKLWGKNWKTKLSSDPSLSIFGMMDAAEKGKLKSLYIMGENPARSFGNTERIEKILSGIDFLIVQDILDTETCRHAHVILPGAACLEKNGSFINIEGERQFFEVIQSPPGEARPDLDILDSLYTSLKNIPAGSTYYHDILTEIDTLIHIQEHPETGTANSLSRLSGITESYGKTGSDTTKGITAIGVPSYTHLGSGTRTENSRKVSSLNQGCEVRLSPEDSKILKVYSGNHIKLKSEEAQITAIATVDYEVPKGVALIPMGQGGNQAADILMSGYPGKAPHVLIHITKQ